MREQVDAVQRMQEYLHARRLSRAALQLRDTADRVLDVALDTAFESHEGFTRAFAGRFGLSPEQYRKELHPLALFMPRSARDYLLHSSKGGCVMNEQAHANTILSRWWNGPQADSAAGPRA